MGGRISPSGSREVIIAAIVAPTVESPQLSDAAQVTQTEAFQASRVLTIAAGHGIHDTYTGFVAPLLPVFIANLSLSHAQGGLLMVFLQGPSLLQPAIGHLADRINLRYVAFLGPAFAAVVMSLLGVARSYVVLALLLTLVGISSAGFHAVASVMAGNLSGRKLGQGMGWWMVGAEFGRALGPLMVVTAIQFLTLKGLPWLMLIGLLGSAILYMRLHNVSARPATVQNGLPWRQALSAMGPMMLPVAGITFLRALMIGALTTYLPTFLREQGAALWICGAALTVFQTSGTVGALMGGSISDLLGRRLVLATSILVSPLMMLGFLSARGVMQPLLLLPLGFAALSVNPVVMALVQETFPENRALANGIYLSLLFVSNSLMSVAVGALGDWCGLRTAFTASAIAPLLSLPLLALLPRGKSQRADGP